MMKHGITSNTKPFKLNLRNEKKMSRPARMTKKWEPKEWRPEYDRIVGYSFLGLGNESIATRVNLGKQQVSNILNLPEAKLMMMALQMKQKAALEKSIPEALDEISKKAIERIHTLINDDVYFEKSPFAVVDRSIAVLKGVGHIKEGSAGNGGVNNFNFNLPPEIGEVMIEGLQKAREAKQLHSSRDVTDATEIDKKENAA